MTKKNKAGLGGWRAGLAVFALFIGGVVFFTTGVMATEDKSARREVVKNDQNVPSLLAVEGGVQNAQSLDEAKKIEENKLAAMSEQQKGEIFTQNCGRIKNHFKSVQKNDSRAREYLGKKYERALSHFIIPLNLSFVKSNVPAADFVQLQGEISAKREEFNRGFIEYSQDLEGLIFVDCTNGESFLKKLDETRLKRKKLAETVNNMQKLLKKHADAVKKWSTETNNWEFK
jgi:hypothetical protein